MDKINVMYAADDNYAEIMGVSILSLIQLNRDEDLCFFIVEDEISQENKDKLQRMITDEDKEVYFIKKPDIRGLLGVELKTLRWSDSSYSRLFLKRIFKNFPEVKKLLYIDCDTLVVDYVRLLWETDIQNYLGAACLECMSNMHKRIIGAKPTDNYVNTGMLLINVERWLNENIEEVAADFIRKHKGKTEYVDQGVINGTISNKFKLVSPRYNLTALAYDFTYEEMQIYRKPHFGYSKEEWENAKAAPAIVHFTTSFLSVRPWYEGSKHPYAEQWESVHEQSPWKDCGYRVLKKREQRDRKEKMYRSIPRWLAVRVAGFLHSYVKPVVYLAK